MAAQDYDILHSSTFPEIPGWPKWTFSSPQTFKLSSGEPMVIQLVTWYYVLFLSPRTIHFLFQNTRKVIRLSVTKLQTHLTPPPAGRQLDWGAGCSTGTLPFKDKEKHTVGAHQKFQTLFLLFSLKPGRRLKRQKCGFFSQLHCFLLTSYYLFWDLWWYFPKNTLKAPC